MAAYTPNNLYIQITNSNIKETTETRVWNLRMGWGTFVTV
jgi:hypothetical protein